MSVSDDLERQRRVRESLIRHYFTDPAYLESEMGRKDLVAHLERRLDENRHRVVPWIESFLALAGMRVLEIGCGTGSSTLALAERGAILTAIDIREDSIQVARDRCEIYGYDIDFRTANAAELGAMIEIGRFDAIIFYAALEHMTAGERRTAMYDSWKPLAPGAHWIIIETPNRLWPIDGHTSLLPFFNWLPDELAFEYSRLSPRPFFREMYLERTPENELHFLRRGRGVSFHEFELYLAPRQELDIVSYLPAPAENADPHVHDWIRLLASASPGLHPAFLQPYLNFALRKA